MESENEFLEKSYTNVMEKLPPDPFVKNQNCVYLWISSLKFYTVCFYFMSKLRTIKIY